MYPVALIIIIIIITTIIVIAIIVISLFILGKKIYLQYWNLKFMNHVI